jgi:nicotinate-nucleotide pyrophosphorylase (carboxylating)
MRTGDYMPLVELALREDLGEMGDITSQAVVPEEQRSAILWSKDDGVLAGEEVFAAVFEAVDPSVSVLFDAHDGAKLTRGMRVAEVRGKALSLLSAERTAINFIAFLSGIATTTRELVDLARASWIRARHCPAGARCRSTPSPWAAAGITGRASTTWF